ncbi:hypothetical protein PENTCL1PPCAC_2538 [Pristionchus entomophagus]|uniref:Saccharopine dehydrogenase NADP binding domain-containing protein n=1 Tax=Pristionchus entomophagus TaxID=358040 RepID=A0AAV5SDS9_9BILA|nr:hypothetical protein PENTCL1PPCAC_2538 [Pristionchus entomophagus]
MVYSIWMGSRYDIVVYGATGFTGSYIVRAIATSPLFKGKTVAVAGRSEGKIRATLEEIVKDIGVADVSKYPIIIADTSDEKSLAAMAKQAKVIINAVGPYRLHGEAVVRAAVENGASHVDVSGEPAYLEKMEMNYAEQAKEKGVYVVGACGWDSIPCDLGTDFLKRNFDGTLGYVETFVSNHRGPSGYSFNAGTYQTLILGISSMREDNLGKMRRAIMPNRLPDAKYKAPKRGALWKVNEDQLQGWALPFLGSDKSIVQRSQYYDFHVNGKKPVQISTYFSIGSLFWAILVTGWLTIFAVFCMFKPTRKLLQAYPDQCSVYMFKNSGPTKQQMKEASFEYFFFGSGWANGETVDEQKPNKTASAVCRGPDPGYIGTSACVVSAALSILEDTDKLPKQGGVYTTASAFRDTRIFDYLKSFGVTYEMIPEKK